MRFYTGKMFPAEYQNNIFIAMRGSWNRTVKQGYNVMRVELDESGKVSKHEPFLDRLPDRREGRSADVGPAGRRAGDARRLAAGVGRLQRHHLPRQLRRSRWLQLQRKRDGASPSRFHFARPRACAAIANLRCAACHGDGGNSTNPAVPSLAGQPAQFIAMSLFHVPRGQPQGRADDADGGAAEATPT